MSYSNLKAKISAIVKTRPPVVQVVDYKEFVGWLSDFNDVAAPTMHTIKNTIGQITPSYAGVGQYVLTSNGLFTNDKAVVFAACHEATTIGASLVGVDSSVINIRSVFAGVYSDGKMQRTSIMIRVYN